MANTSPSSRTQAHYWEGDSLPLLRMAPRGEVDSAGQYWWLHGNPPALPSAGTGSPTTPWQRLWLGAWIVVLSLLSYWLISRYVITAVQVQGRSMTPTLQDGERYFLNRLIYLWREPARGDLAVIEDPGYPNRAVKRIIGLPGDLVQIRDGCVYINGQKLAEPYLAPGTHTQPGPALAHAVRLGPDSYFVLGDNRACSEDSRHYGPIHRRQIVGLISK